jgi:CBS domain-containing protein
MFKASKIMTRSLVTVRENTSIQEAMNILVDNNIAGLPVVTEDMRLLGIVSEKDMLSLLYKPQSKKPKLVSEVMTRDVVHFNESDDLFDICECLIENKFRRVPILAEGKLAGIISRRDIIKFIIKLRNKSGRPL